MTFDELREEAWKEINLPKEARQLLPQSLSEKTKDELVKSGLSSNEIARIVETAVNKIEHGSIESIDRLISSAIR